MTRPIIPKPMLASLPRPNQGESLEELASKGWTFERKYDGVRVIVQRKGDAVRLWTRTGRNIAAAFPEVVQSILSASRPATFLMDGELELVSPRRQPLSALTSRVNMSSPRTILAAAVQRPAWVQAFDVLDDDLSLPRLRQTQRRERLLEMVEALHVDAVQPAESGDVRLFERTKRDGEEGVIAKDPRGLYVPGARTREWLKFKHRYSLTAIAVRMDTSWAMGASIGGRPFRNITVALLKGNEPVLVGEVGTGFTLEEMTQLADRIENAEYPIVEITVVGRTKDGLREPVFVGLRTDLTFAACEIAQLSEIPVL